MGGTAPSKQKFVYAVPITEAQQGETAIYRNPDYKDELITLTGQGCSNAQEMYLHNFKNYPNDEFLGAREILADGTLADSFTWQTYGEVEAIAQQLGSGIAKLGLTEEKAQYQDYKIKFISIYAGNSREWVLTDVANSLYGYTTMPIYDTLGEEATIHMFNETELSTVFLTCNHIKGVAKNIKDGSYNFLKNLVIMDERNFTEELQALCQGIQVYTFNQVIEAGEGNILEYPKIDPNQIAFFSYTSGTTGKPKGAMIAHRNLVSAVGGAQKILPFEDGWTHLSYLPLAHVFERIVMFVFIACHGRYGVFGGDVRKIKEDLAILKPDIFVSVPRLFNKFYDAIQGKMRAATGVKAVLANKALKSKEDHYNNGGYYTHKVWDKLVFSKMKQVLGGNVKYMLTGSAPISSEVRKFMKICFACPFAEGYGQTEALGGQFVTHPEDPGIGYVGGVIPHLEFKLKDVPEMNYFSTDKDAEGNPTPRGEILSRGGAVIPGYYKNEQKSKDTIDEDGWLHSGDIGMILPNGALKIIDRVKNIFKLSIGEYIAPDKLQEVYKTVRGVSDIFVYGDSLKSVLVAIVYSEEPELTAIAKELGIEGSYAELCANEDINKWFIAQLLAKQKESGLKGFERIKKIHIEPQSFEQLELLTTTFKIKRHIAKNHFQTTLDNLYQGLY